MALFVRQDKGRSELQTKVAADLRERLKARAIEPQPEHEPTILENQHQTKSSGVIIWILLIGLCAVIALGLMKIGGVF